MIEHAHGNAENATTRAFLLSPALTKEDLWPLFKKTFRTANPPESVQKDIDSLPKTYDAIIKAGGQKLRHNKKTT